MTSSRKTHQHGNVLVLQDFGIRYGSRQVLSGININIACKGVTVILGPSGTGKSSLLRTLSGANDGHPTLKISGKWEYLQEELRPPLVMQKAKLMTSSVLENLVNGWPLRPELTVFQQYERISNWLEGMGLSRVASILKSPVIELSAIDQRLVAVLRVALLNTPLILVDEPTAGLTYEQSMPIIDLLRQLGMRQSVLVVMHHLEQTKSLADSIILLASGRVQEIASSKKFFLQPSSAAGKQFVLTGSCPEDPLDDDFNLQASCEDVPHTEKVQFYSNSLSATRPRSLGPNGFAWLIEGELAGTPWPGLIRTADYDLQLLSDVGVTRLFSLTDRAFASNIASAYGIAVSHDSITDMEPPLLPQAISICKRLNAAIQHGEVVAVHCKAGLGRTGTVLASYWIWRNEGNVSGDEALRHIRLSHPGWVQSKSQIEFINRFALAVASFYEGTEVTE